MQHLFPPLASRVYVSRSNSRVVVPEASLRPPKYKQWSEEQMSQAYSSVINNGLSVRRAALEYDVPRATLGDRVSGKVLAGSKSGKQRYLNDDEEEELVRFLINSAKIGYPRSRLEVLAIVQQICDSKQIDTFISHGWWERFCQRHANLSLRTAATLSQARVKGSTPEEIDAYFDTLEQTLVDNDLLDKPGQIYNIDETGVPLDPKKLKAVFKKGVQNPLCVSSGTKSQITVVGCISASGHAIPPMVIWDRKTLHPDMTVGELPGTFYGMTHNGWMNHELFDNWFGCHFLRYAPPVRPLLLLMDGHSSHYCPDAICLAAKEKVILFTFPPNTTHLTQPLDHSCFGPLKMEWRKVCQNFLTQNPGKVVTRFSFSALFAEAWQKSMTMPNIIAGFRATGLYPLDRSRLKEPPSISIHSLAEESGLAYIPLLSPAPERKQKLPVIPSFSEEEMDYFYNHYQKETSSIENDERYRLWKKMYHPHLEATGDGPTSFQDSFMHTPVKKGQLRANVAVLARPQSTIQHMLRCPSPLTTLPSVKPKTSCRVLTSSENLKNIEEKQKKKNEVAQLKQERQKKREEKRKEKAAKVAATKRTPRSANLSEADSDDIGLNDDFDFNLDLCSDTSSLISSNCGAVASSTTAKKRKTWKSAASGITTRSKAGYQGSRVHGSGSPSVQVVTVDDNYETSPSLTTWVSNLQLTIEDRRVLADGKWLTANHISAASSLLKQSFPDQNGLCDTSYLAEKLDWPSTPHKFVQIIHVGGCHWACLSNKLVEDETHVVELFDSVHTEPGYTIKEQACTILHCDQSLLTIRVVNVQRQQGGDNCGLFAVAMAFDLCEGRDPFLCSYKETLMRSHLEDCFEQECITRFPQDEVKARRRKRIVKQVDVELFCICRYPDVDVTSHFGDMACCQRCKLWYHAVCMKIPEDVFKKPSRKWLCSKCAL